MLSDCTYAGTLWSFVLHGMYHSDNNLNCVFCLGYWPSYNVPFFDEVYTRSGYPDFVKKHGLDFSYQLAPRAKIFRRDEGTVKDMGTMKKMMRYNGRVNFFFSDWP